ncbi:MAG TPA: hypothetical protein VG675_15590 [Bryobacteraceae bacterium]|nr:hypothetical protein [Bryobacteraceae bacterium]
MNPAASVKMEKAGYKGWPNCYRVSNGVAELIVTSDIGPRIMRYGFVGGQNFFKEFEAQLGKSGEKDWQIRGGHRLWMAPEDRILTYAPDNQPAEVRIEGEWLEATGPVEELTGLEKRIAVRMAAQGAGVEVLHSLRNAGQQTLEVATWALSIMAPGGTGVHGFPPRGTHPEILAPTNPLVMWAFTDLTDPRWQFTPKYLILKQEAARRSPQKLGTWNAHTWAAYLLNGQAFIKRYEAPGEPGPYPDYGCSYETFTNGDFLELETLGPIQPLAPGATITHLERWSLHANVSVPALTDGEIDRVLLPLVAQ